MEINPSCEETEIIIRTDRQTELTDEMIKAVEHCVENRGNTVVGYQKGTLTLLAPRDIFRVYTESRKLIICTDAGRYEVRRSLKDLEEELDHGYFVRISRFEIVNLRKVARFDLSTAGTIRMIFQNGSETWVARRYVQTIQKMLKSSKTERKE